jgi:hypothetical protein
MISKVPLIPQTGNPSFLAAQYLSLMLLQTLTMLNNSASFDKAGMEKGERTIHSPKFLCWEFSAGCKPWH